MKYYVFTIEQIHSDGSLSEYATKSDAQATEKAARSVYYDKLSAVNADLSPNGHSYMSIKLEDSKGNVLKKDELGEYIEA